MRASRMNLAKKMARKLPAIASGVPKVQVISEVHAKSATNRMREEKARRRAEMTGLNKAFTEGTRMEELTAAKTAPMTNGLSSKATGGTLYTMKPVISSADRFREARLHGEPLEAIVNNTATSSSADSGNASILPLVGIIAFGAATAFAIMEYPEHQGEIAQYVGNLKSFGFASSDYTPGIEQQADSIAKQPVWLQRQR